MFVFLPVTATYSFFLSFLHSNWPTFPQVYMNSELMGGADIMLQMHQSGDLVKELEKIGHKSTLKDEPESADT